MDRFRKSYGTLSEAQKSLGTAIKEQAEGLDRLFDEIKAQVPTHDPRCVATAMTKLEEAVMWAVKHITR